jgi:hypothetical protein
MVSSTWENWPAINISPLAIISFRLQGMRDTLGNTSFETLQPWLEGNLVHFDINFDWLTTDDEIDFDETLDEMCGLLETKYQRYAKF